MAKSSSLNYYPPVGFYFSVDLFESAASHPERIGIGNSFKEVSGLNIEFETEVVAEGVENRFVHRLPKKAKYPNLVLKRGLMAADGALFKWCLNVMQLGLANPIEPKIVLVTLLDADDSPAMSWQFFNAWPVKVQFSDLESDESNRAVEVLEFQYQYFEQKTLS